MSYLVAGYVIAVVAPAVFVAVTMRRTRALTRGRGERSR